MEKLYFNDLNDAKKYFRSIASDYYGEALLKKGVDTKKIFSDSADQLRDIKLKLNELLKNRFFIGDHTYFFYKNFNIEITDRSKSRVIYPYHMRTFIEEIIEIIDDRINNLEQAEKVNSIKELVNELPENEVKKKLSNEIKDLELKKAELEKNKASDRERLQEEIEFGKHRTEMMEKKYNIFLKFLDRESIASMVGSILLLLMGICLLVMMFLQKEPIKIVESAFLLILGYFFGHSKNNK